MDFLFSSTNLLFLWIFAGAVCFVPLIVRNRGLKYAIVAIVLSVVYVTFIVNKEFIGRPRYDAVVEDFVYKGHSISMINGKKYITIWLRDKKDDLLVRVLHTNEIQKKLVEAQRRSRNGIPQKGKIFMKKDMNAFKKGIIDLMVYDLPFQERFPKK